MTVQTNPITITGIICSVFWCAIYALTLLLLSVSRIWLTLTNSRGAVVETQSNYISANNPLKHKTT
jgi:hypothetical protein